MGGIELREKVRAAYSSAAENPQGKHAFPVGRAFAESVGYPAHWLDRLPSTSIDSFTGVSAVSVFAEVPRHGTVLDMGCGAGLDSLLLARRVGPLGRVTGIDFSWPMLQQARCSAVESGTTNVLFCQADGECLPLKDSSIDVVVVNGIFNLNPARESIFRELARCTRPGGSLYAAELILREPLPAGVADESNWFA